MKSIASLTRPALAALFFAAVLIAPATAQVAPNICGSIANAYGPFDYRTDKDKLEHVERPHFPPVVEALIRGNRGYLGQDIDYTLRVFPNHHRALIAVMRYGEKLKTPKPSDMPYSVECYFERAVRFRPDDAIVRMIYAQFLSKDKRRPEALQQLERAATADTADSGFTQYNIGLVYVEMKEYDRALVQAHKAIQLGFLRTTLREQLEAAGKWVDAPATAGSAESAAPPASGADKAALK